MRRGLRIRLEFVSRYLSALSYGGGKSSNSSAGVGRWVAARLPHLDGYCEPFAGMLGVLLARRACRVEVVNDLEGALVDWWQIVRDSPDALLRALALTPHSRVEFDRCRAAWDSGLAGLDALERARVVTVLIGQSPIKRLPTHRSWWHAQIFRRSGTDLPRVTSTTWHHERKKLMLWIEALAFRMRDVVIESGDASGLIRRYVDSPDMVIYCDPPYVGKEGYSVCLSDAGRAAMLDAVADCPARVAVSGFTGDWPELDALDGWHCDSRVRLFAGYGHGYEVSRRVECLWTNYLPMSFQRSLFDG